MSQGGEKTDKVNVAVRLRPLNKREIEMNTPVVVDMEKNQTILYPVAPLQRCDDDARNSIKTFAFDHCFWSVDPSNPKYASQETVFECLGKGVMDNAFRGYNACIFAYGQTGSGKSYTMMGSHNTKGIIPKLCDALFARINAAAKVDTDTQYKVEVSYMEIYNEKVHDLLDVQGHRKHLRVREHAILGPYVDGLSQLVVTSYEDIDKLMSEGNKSRTVAATNMNSESSRSHAVFNIRLTQTLSDPASGVSGEKVSKISLVDLAGSERAQKTGAVGERLREGCNINKSLTTLMLVISALAESSATAGGKPKPSGEGKSASQAQQGGRFVPYRDSVLTWLLKDNLGGNSKTVMVATLSPAADNYEETLSTLRYADRAKRIVNHAKVNEDPNSKLIMELRAEVDRLKHELETAKERQTPVLKEKLEESEKLVKELTKTWEEKLLETERIHKERHDALEKMGISVQTSGIKVEKSKFYMVNLNADPSLNELLVYYLKDRTKVGSDSSNDIQLYGLGIMKEHCVLEITNNEVFVIPFENARTLINGHAATERLCLRHGDRILWGTNHFFRLHCPKPAASAMTTSSHGPSQIPADKSVDSNLADYTYAQEEVMLAELQDDPIKQVVQDLEKHHANEKELALARQRQEYEQQLEMLKSQLAPSHSFMSSSWHPTDQQHAIMMQAQAFAAQQYPHMPPLVSTPGDPTMGPYSIPPIMWASSMASLSGMASGPSAGAKGGDSGIGMGAGGFMSPLSASVSCHDVQSERHSEWVQEREKLMKQSLVKLREQVAKANALVREANFLASELHKNTEYSVTLQIPSSHLSPNGKKGGVAIEPTILVKRSGKPNQLWSMEKFENKIIDMREYYEDCVEQQQARQRSVDFVDGAGVDSEDKNESTLATFSSYLWAATESINTWIFEEDLYRSVKMEREDPFFDVQEEHTLIGVANMYLRCVFYDAPFKYRVPIINQQGEIAGKLLMELSRSSGDLPDPHQLSINGSQSPWISPGSMSAVSKNGYSNNMGGLSSSTSHGNLSATLLTTKSPVSISSNDILACSTPLRKLCDVVAEESHTSRSESGYSLSGSSSANSGPRQVTIRVRILQASQLPDKLANFVFCQYHFWGEKDMTVVPPPLQTDYQRRRGDCVTYKFAHEAEYVVNVTDDFLEHLAEDALSVEIYGHRTPQLPSYAADVIHEQTSSSYFSNDSSMKYKTIPGSVLSLDESSVCRSDNVELQSIPTTALASENNTPCLTMPLSHQPLNSSARDMRRFAERWAELYRRLEYWVAIEELNEEGSYEKVEVVNAGDVGCGGVYQLRHGQSRRVRVVIRPNKVHRGKGSLPLVCDSIREVHMGSIMNKVRQPDDALDSYQDSDLNFLRDCWSDAVRRRQIHLQEQLQKIINLPGKTAADEEREQSLMNQWMRLTDERNAVTFPEPGSGIPGAPASWNPPSCMEKHCPVIFLNINVDQVTSSSAPQHVSVLDANVSSTVNCTNPGLNTTLPSTSGPSVSPVIGVAGVNCRLPYEEETQRSQNFQKLEIVKRYETVLGAIASWDASRHDQLYLNRVTPNNERVYMIVKTTVRLSHPICVDLILRKRIAVNIYKPAGSWTGSFKKQMNKLFSAETTPAYWTGVTFQIVSSIPQASLELEERESLAQMAASQGENSVNTVDSESYIEKYLRTVSALDSGLQLDRSRQEIALKEILAGFRRQQQAQRALIQPPFAGRDSAPSDGVNKNFNSSLYGSNVSHGSSLALDRINGKANMETLRVNGGIVSSGAHERSRTSGINPDVFRNCSLGGIRKYISVPNLQGLTQSLQQNSTNQENEGGSNKALNTNTCIQEENSDPSDTLMETNGQGNKLRKRPEPPKALLMAAKHPLISPLATQSVTAGSMFQCVPPAHLPSSKSSILQPLTEEVNQQSPQSRTNKQPLTYSLSSSSQLSSHNNSMPSQRDTTDVSVFEPIEPRPQEVLHLNPLKSRFTSDESSCNQIRKNPFAANETESPENSWLEELGSSCYNLSSHLENNTNSLTYFNSSASSIGAPESNSAAHSIANDVGKFIVHEHSVSDVQGSLSLTDWLRLDAAVEVLSSGDANNSKGKKLGCVKFIGSTQFAPGEWVGVQLLSKEGRNDGTIQGVRYFHCPPGHGIFIRPDKLRPAPHMF